MKRLLPKIYFPENLLFPPKCMNCGEFLDIKLGKKVDSPLCDRCRLLWEREKTNSCSMCGLDMKRCVCMPKTLKRSECSALLKLVSYKTHGEMPIRRFIFSLKHSYNKSSFEFIAEQLRFLLIPEMKIRDLLPKDCIITYLPRSLKNKNKDGFDQGRELAKALSRITGIRLIKCFNRRLFVSEQKKLNSFERNLNMRSAFKLNSKSALLKDKTVILVDDIVTTGAGMSACTRLLYSASVYDVVGICVGFTQKDKK